MLKDMLLEVDGQHWLVREAVSHEAALSEIAMARVTGSVGSKARRDETLCGGSVTVIADVERFTGDVADKALSFAVAFMGGFEDDETQEGVAEARSALRAATSHGYRLTRPGGEI